MLVLSPKESGTLSGTLSLPGIQIQISDHPFALAEGSAPLDVDDREIMANFVAAYLEKDRDSYLTIPDFGSRFNLCADRRLTPNAIGRLRNAVGLQTKMAWVDGRAQRVVPGYRWRDVSETAEAAA